MVFWNKDLLFSEISPTTYKISVYKEIFKRHLKNAREKKVFATTKSDQLLPNVVSVHQSNLIKKGPGIDPELQYNKAHNIDIASRTMDKIIREPGEEFSFWHLVGKINEKKGYMDGRVIIGDSVEAETGGGLCNLANTLNLLILHSPLEITELNTHSDALAADFDHRVPFANGTSVAYNYVDYRFKNSTDQTIQICMSVQGETLEAELRSEKPFDNRYELLEEDHHVIRKNDKYYRRSQIYRQTIDKKSEEVTAKELIWDNKSQIMFDPKLIPAEMIRS